MSQEKLLTITVPCYNSQDYMRGCVDSLLVGGDRVEIIIIDDGSVDQTGAIADEYAEKHPDKNGLFHGHFYIAHTVRHCHGARVHRHG